MKPTLLIALLLIIALSPLLVSATDRLPDHASKAPDTGQGSLQSPPVSEQEARDIVTQIYHSTLYRDPDPSGLNTYVGHMLTGGKDAAWVRAELLNSLEGRAVIQHRQYLFSLAAALVALSVIPFLLRRRLRGLLNDRGRPLLRWVHRLYLLFLLNGLLGCVVLQILLPSPHTETAATYALKFVRGQAWHDSWHPMTMAIEHLRASPQPPLYSKILLTDRIKFQYPPTALPLLDIGQRLTQASWPDIWRVLNSLSWAFVLAIGVCAAYLLLEAIRYSIPPECSDDA
jgi:hypothetical protein